MENKRKGMRVNVKFEVFFRKINSKLISSTRSKDVSEVGLCIPLKQYYAPESILEIEVRCEDFARPIKTQVRVIRIDSQKNDHRFPFEAGVEFLDLSPEQRGLIRAYIKRAVARDGQDLHWEG